VLHIAVQDIGNGFDATVGMPGKTLDVIFGFIRAKIIEQQEGVEFGDLAEAEDPIEMNAGALDDGFWFEYQFDCSCIHNDASFIQTCRQWS
jgi:hypothetical protein